MPEKVRIRFEEDGKVQNERNGSTSHGQKRRLDGSYANKGSTFRETNGPGAKAVHAKQPGPSRLSNGMRRSHEGEPRRGAKAVQPSRPSNGILPSNKQHPKRQSIDSRNFRNQNKQGSKSDHRESRLNDKQRALMHARSALPIWSHTADIRHRLQDPLDVMLLVGETGSGKSTQVPQYLMDEPWCKRCIAITQPRRVAAISLARRVADEMGSTLGNQSPASRVGYSVRFDSSVSPAMKIKFLTEGMLLQEMLRDPWLTSYSCVVVDEVHERSVNVDLILGFLRNMVTHPQMTMKKRKGERLKVVVMSATAEIDTLTRFFQEGYKGNFSKSQAELDALEKWAAAKPIEKAESHLNGSGEKSPRSDSSETSWAGFSSAVEDSADEERTAQPRSPEQMAVEHISTKYIEGRQHTVTISYLDEPAYELYDKAAEIIFRTHRTEPLPGDILVFVTGQDTVESLEALVNEQAAALDTSLPKVQVLPLFAALPQQAQAAIFQPAPPGTRKVIIATNIAETSVTIPGVRFVLDSGLAKVKEFRASLGLDSLLVKPISKSAAIQRAGRAGREAPGKCYRLYTRQDFEKLEEANVPEILRCDLASAILTMKARGIDNVMEFPLLSRPPTDAMRRALLHLLRLGAIDADGHLTARGKKMARLPLAPAQSRVLIAASECQEPSTDNISGPLTSTDNQPASSDILLAAIDIISALTVEKLFLPLTTEEDNEKASEARSALLRREGDHLTLLSAVRGYAAEHADRRAWCTAHFISHRAMKSVMDVRKQLRQQCATSKLLTVQALADAVADDNAGVAAPPLAAARAATLLRCFMAGFAANTARAMPDGSFRTVEGNHAVAIHPGSVMFGRRVEAVMYNELVFTQKNYARGVSAVQMDWYEEACKQ